MTDVSALCKISMIIWIDKKIIKELINVCVYKYKIIILLFSSWCELLAVDMIIIIIKPNNYNGYYRG